MAEELYVDWDGLVYYDGKIKDYIDEKAEVYIKMGGFTKFETLPDPSVDNLNYIYKITDSFITNSDFKEPNLVCSANTWVQCTEFNNVFLYTLFNEAEADVDLSKYATIEYVDKQIADIEHPTIDLDGYATEDYVDEAIRNIPDVDLSDYYTKGELDAILPDTFITSQDIDTAIETALEDVVYQNQLTEINESVARVETALEDKADKADLTGLATESWVKSELANIDPTIPSEYITETELTSALNDYAKSSELTSLATKAELEAVQQVAGSNSVKLFAIESDLVDITSKLETIPSIEGLASEQFVTDRIAEIDIPTKVSDLDNDKNYITLSDVPQTDLSNYYSKTETETLVNEAVKGIDIPDTSSFITMQDVENKGYLTEVPSEYITETELADEIAKIEHPTVDLSNYYNKSETDTKIKEAFDAVPETDLSDYSTTSQMQAAINTAVSMKADDIPFTGKLVVKNPVGGFTRDESVQGLTIAQILTKLLDLQEYVEPETVVDTIINEAYPIFTESDIGGSATTDFQIIDIDAKAKDNNGNSIVGFYHNEDDTVAGYQVELPAGDDGDPMTVYIPANATLKAAYQWSSLSNSWAISDVDNFKLVGTETKVISGNEVMYNKYEWDEEYYGGVIYAKSNWRLEIEV